MSDSLKKITWWQWVAIVFVAAFGYWGLMQMPTELERRLEAGETYIYFVNRDDLSPVAARRDVDKAQAVEVAMKTAVEQLLAGPTKDEVALKMATAIRKGASLKSLAIEGDTVRLDFSKQLADNIKSAEDKAAALTQITKTAMGFPGIRKVVVMVEGAEYE